MNSKILIKIIKRSKIRRRRRKLVCNEINMNMKMIMK